MIRPCAGCGTITTGLRHPRGSAVPGAAPPRLCSGRVGVRRSDRGCDAEGVWVAGLPLRPARRRRSRPLLVEAVGRTGSDERRILRCYRGGPRPAVGVDDGLLVLFSVTFRGKRPLAATFIVAASFLGSFIMFGGFLGGTMVGARPSSPPALGAGELSRPTAKRFASGCLSELSPRRQAQHVLCLAP